jgi:hypothetical protein
MKIKFVIPALISSALLTFNLSAFAGDHGSDSGSDSENECDIHGAKGVCKIESDNEDGVETAKIECKTAGLDVGDYTLSATRLSDGSNVFLCQFTVASNLDEEAPEGEESEFHFEEGWIDCNWGGYTNWGCWTNWSMTDWCNSSNAVPTSETEVDCPADLNPTDIGQIIVSDVNGNPVLIGDLTTPAPTSVINITASVRVTPGVAAPFATGTAKLQSTATKGKWKHQFNLTASGVVTNATLSLHLNGKKAGAARSNKAGQMAIKKLPGRVPAVRSIRLLDRKGNEAAHVRF